MYGWKLVWKYMHRYNSCLELCKSLAFHAHRLCHIYIQSTCRHQHTEVQDVIQPTLICNLYMTNLASPVEKIIDSGQGIVGLVACVLEGREWLAFDNICCGLVTLIPNWYQAVKITQEKHHTCMHRQTEAEKNPQGVSLRHIF